MPTEVANRTFCQAFPELLRKAHAPSAGKPSITQPPGIPEFLSVQGKVTQKT